MLALKRSLLNREEILINVLKALALVISMCTLHVIFLSKRLHRDNLHDSQRGYFVHSMKDEPLGV
jgi:hypothetical protein